MKAFWVYKQFVMFDDLQGIRHKTCRQKLDGATVRADKYTNAGLIIMPMKYCSSSIGR